MATVFDYLHWRGDLSLSHAPFTNVDALILSRLSYFPMDRIVPPTFKDNITIEACAMRMLDAKKSIKPWYDAQDSMLLHALSESVRFRTLKLSGFRNDVDKVAEKQFACVTISLGDETHFISFRGTDNTLVGWKEDINMSFEMPVPAQQDAALYLSNALSVLSGTVRIGGHSKGGNLAVYSAAKLPAELQHRITQIFNLDGPGFTHIFMDSAGYHAVRNRVQTFVPQTSIVGMLLEHESSYSVIESTQKGILQHDVYSWKISRNDFLYLATVDSKSTAIEQTIKTWLNGFSNEDREEFIDTLFSTISSVQADTISELVQNVPQNAPLILKTLAGMQSTQRKALQKALQTMLSAMHGIAKQFLPTIKSLSE